VITAKDDPLVPFEVYRHSAFQNNPALTLIVPEHGGHLGFLSRHKPRFWLDGIVLDWIGSHDARALCGSRGKPASYAL
jgi:predicted alpha/beta-fold hydrolase